MRYENVYDDFTSLGVLNGNKVLDFLLAMVFWYCFNLVLGLDLGMLVFSRWMLSFIGCGSIFFVPFFFFFFGHFLWLMYDVWFIFDR